MMKKAIGGISALVLMFALATPASSQVFAGGGLIYGADIDPFDLGVQAGAYLGLDNVLPGLRLGGDLEFYFPESRTVGGLTARANLLALNGNAQYHFLRAEEGLNAYALGGLSLGRASVSAMGQSESNTEIDINLGSGVEFPVQFGRIFGEIKLVAGDYDRIVIGGGVRVGL